MCGIFGIITSDESRIHKDSRILDKMASSINHRGPDDRGFLVSPPCHMGMVRLSILDLQGGHQPIHSEDKASWIVFNGEIYNYREIRLELEKHGHEFYTHSDTETIIHLYEEYGHDCVHHLNGMFAFAIWDEKSQELFLARDRLGVKPLYYYHDQKQFVFASEIKAILALREITPEVDLHALNTYMHLRYVPGPRTMFKNIFKLLPGHLMVVRQGSITIHEYWDARHGKEPLKTKTEYLERFEYLFNDSVKKRLISDVPLGVFLSGGLDSSAVAAVAANFVDTPLKTFSVIFDVREELNEEKYAREVARRYGFQHYNVTVSVDDFISFLPEFVWFMDEPVADPAAIPLYYVSKLAREHVKVVLSGEGSDELFAGYWEGRSLRGLDRIRYYKMLPYALRKAVIEKIASKVFDRRKLDKFIRKADSSWSNLASLTLEHELENGVMGLWSQELLSSTDFGDPLERFKDYLLNTDADNYLDQRLYMDMKGWLPDDLLVKADKMTMANSIELRVPFLDYRLVQFATSLPNSLRLEKVGRDRYRTKPLLRDAMKDKLPKEIVERRKWGFLNPSLPWLRKKECLEFVTETLLSTKARSRGLFDDSYIDSLFAENRLQSRSLDTILWKLLVFELWCNRYLDGSSQQQNLQTASLQEPYRLNV